MEKKKITQIQYKIVKIKKLSYYENDLQKLGIKEKKIKNSNVDYGASMVIEHKTGTVSFTTIAKFYVEKQTKRIDLFGIETLHSFRIRNFSDVIPSLNNNEFQIPNNIMQLFLNISISGMRGMIALLNTKPEYCELVFPIVNTEKLLEDLKFGEK